MAVVFTEQSDVPFEPDESHRFVYFLGNYSITVDTDDVEISRELGILLAKTFQKAGLGTTQEIASMHAVKGKELNYPISCTCKLDVVLH